jgi:hypothetical protein
VIKTTLPWASTFCIPNSALVTIIGLVLLGFEDAIAFFLKAEVALLGFKVITPDIKQEAVNTTVAAQILNNIILWRDISYLFNYSELFSGLRRNILARNCFQNPQSPIPNHASNKVQK